MAAEGHRNPGRGGEGGRSMTGFGCRTSADPRPACLGGSRGHRDSNGRVVSFASDRNGSRPVSVAATRRTEPPVREDLRSSHASLVWGHPHGMTAGHGIAAGLTSRRVVLRAPLQFAGSARGALARPRRCLPDYWTYHFRNTAVRRRHALRSSSRRQLGMLQIAIA